MCVCGDFGDFMIAYCWPQSEALLFNPKGSQLRDVVFFLSDGVDNACMALCVEAVCAPPPPPWPGGAAVRCHPLVNEQFANWKITIS